MPRHCAVHIGARPAAGYHKAAWKAGPHVEAELDSRGINAQQLTPDDNEDFETKKHGSAEHVATASS